jgi:O-antigen ligase
MFSHVLFLDPVIETGIVGAMPFVLLFGVIGARLRALWRQKSAHGGFAILPMFAFALMESLVSGHISSVKHLWLLAGVLASVGRSGNLPSRPVTARSGRPSGPVAESGARA